MKSILITLVFITAIASSISSQKQLDGTWKTQEAVKASNNQYLQKTYSFDGEKWESQVLYFQDRDLRRKLFKIRSVGTMKKMVDSELTSFIAEQKYVTIYTDNQRVIMELGLNYCPLTKDVEKDITENGCAFIKSAARTQTIKEKIDLSGNSLKLGENASLVRQ